jgi:hypothetical protein
MMSDKPRSGPQVPQERPDPKVAGRRSEGGDRPGFDLGGASGDATGIGSNTIPGGPKGSPSSGTDAGGRDTGLTNPSGSRSLGDEGNAGSGAGSGPTNSSDRG